MRTLLRDLGAVILFVAGVIGAYVWLQCLIAWAP